MLIDMKMDATDHANLVIDRLLQSLIILIKRSLAVYINEVEGIKRVMNNKKLYARLLTKFKNENNLEGLWSALAVKDYKKAQEIIHAIKGVAGNLALSELFEKSKNFEGQIRTESIDIQTVEAIKVCYGETLNAIDTVITRYV
ncbi:MAG: Hpt domain-containing protein [Treponema sp.]|jgi:HPt (histidine-containing phosphotransfer) domain-containing protein|nr:Hpt domain-containing protein [Treponema sp.]